MQKLLIGFAGLVVILGAWSFLAGKGLPWHQSSQGQRGSRRQGQGQNGQDGYQDEPEGDPADWSREEMKAWLQKRGETVNENTETRVMLLARVQEMRE